MDGKQKTFIQSVTTKDQLWFLWKLVILFLVDLLIEIGQQWKVQPLIYLICHVYKYNTNETNYCTYNELQNKGVTEDSNMTKSQLTTAPVQKR